MNVVLKPADRGNWRKMVQLQLKPGQQTFVSPPAWSLARCHVRFFGDRFDHLPHVIYGDGEPVGYSTLACDPHTEDEYWLDGIMI